MGGAPANFAFHAASLGADSVVASRIGTDPLGNELLQKLNTLKLPTAYIQKDTHHPTGTVTIDLDKKGIPSYKIHENVAWDYIEPTESLLYLAFNCDAVCFGSLAQRNDDSANTIQTFLSNVKPDCLKIFDINLRQNYYSKNIIGDSLYLCDILKLNDEELPVIKKLFDIAGNETQSLAEITTRFKLKLIALTKGADGSLLYTTTKQSMRKSDPVKIVDTVGAGDSFTAALAMGLLKNMNLEEINEHANKIAAFVCSKAGATCPLDKSLLF
jgi:fructokinase